MNVIPNFHKMRIERIDFNEEIESNDKENFDPSACKYSPVKTKPKRRINILKEITERNKKKNSKKQLKEENRESEIENLFQTFRSPLKKNKRTREM
ncbi:hypothetical protein NBO_13g0046 [Nosema bombycis CQ1]|uniref:Uncharacterized protein n=1 Tax=Nosema bombycis (strain CQ1 / CVCC 102059) TaxID=578461 RepID=R0MAA2_NOSB1|nr:hypothetical protein NBO_13g0046 [Nosema bombycis CQ1]|eukprot:EOB14869.1 hypothetical protein NBO_13g0046 [Nosema bombycis CQ1]